jgi:hypothetical protein
LYTYRVTPSAKQELLQTIQEILLDSAEWILHVCQAMHKWSRCSPWLGDRLILQ